MEKLKDNINSIKGEMNGLNKKLEDIQLCHEERFNKLETDIGNLSTLTKTLSDDCMKMLNIVKKGRQPKSTEDSNKKLVPHSKSSSTRNNK